MNDETEYCIRCGEELTTPEGKETGICPDCWDPDKDGDY